MRVYLGSDHAGYELKQHLVNHLSQQGYECVDVGPHAADPGSLGIVIGGSGNGEQIAANKIAGVRSALAWKVEIAQLARQHNDSNVLSIGAREHTLDEAASFAEAFLTTPFSGNERHARRIAELTEYERTHELPKLPGSPAAG
jgi:ribose 5-phosphate isomerase B